jgi:hypothetical protein
MSVVNAARKASGASDDGIHEVNKIDEQEDADAELANPIDEIDEGPQG